MNLSIKHKDDIIVIGDVHASQYDLNEIIKLHNPSIILATGDYGYWANIKFDNPFPYPKNKKTKVFFCDGNHEYHPGLIKLTKNKKSPVKLHNNVFYMPRGSVLKINNYNILFMGGADSIDKEYRTVGYDWFEEELITNNDMLNLPDSNSTNIDIVISHTCPIEFDPMIPYNDYRYQKYNDPSRKFLSDILHIYKPKQWFFGHWHTHISNKYTNSENKISCEWTCLDKCDDIFGHYFKYIIT